MNEQEIIAAISKWANSTAYLKSTASDTFKSGIECAKDQVLAMLEKYNPSNQPL